MPIAVRTPEEIMLETKSNLYFIEFFFPGKFFTYLPKFQRFYDYDLENDETLAGLIDKNNPPGRQEVLDWLGINLPHIKWEMLAPPERSGILAGGLEGRICVHFDDDGLKLFCDRWEVNDTSVDPRFQCGFLIYESFMKNYIPPRDDEMCVY